MSHYGKRKNKSDSNKIENVELLGKVIEVNGDFFKVISHTFNGHDGTKLVSTCRPCGKIRQNDFRILNGDEVRYEVSPFDYTRGRIMCVIK